MTPEQEAFYRERVLDASRSFHGLPECVWPKNYEVAVTALLAAFDVERETVWQLEAQLARMLDIITRIVYASDQCVGHAHCAHSMQPWQDARTLLRDEQP